METICRLVTLECAVGGAVMTLYTSLIMMSSGVFQFEKTGGFLKNLSLRVFKAV